MIINLLGLAVLEIIVETGGSSLDEAVYAPIDHLLELVKSVKLASK